MLFIEHNLLTELRDAGELLLADGSTVRSTGDERGDPEARRTLRDNRGLLVPAEEVTTSGMQARSDAASVEREPVWLDRVTAADLMLIWPEEEG